MNKSFGKLRKWAGGFVADIKPQDRPSIDDDLKALDEDLALRKRGVERLMDVSEGYYRNLVKRKEVGDPEDPGKTRKIHPVEAFGLTLIAYGEQHGEGLYGKTLIKSGLARCKIASGLQSYGKTFQEEYIYGLEQSLRQIKDCQAQRKNLEKRRQANDAVLAKLARAKKDKEREDLEEEAMKTNTAYEHAFEDMQTRVLAVQELETVQMQKMMQLLDEELDFVQSYKEILAELKNDMGDVEYEPRASMKTRGRSLPSTPILSRQMSFKTEAASDSEPESPTKPHTTSFGRSRHRSNSASSNSLTNRGIGSGDFAGGGRSWRTLNHSSSRNSRLNDYDSDASKGPGRRPSTQSFGSSSFRRAPATPSRSTTKLSISSAGPRMVKAVHDYTATGSGELELTRGEEVSVLQEVSSDWWLGECNGRRGLFPSTHTQDITPSAHQVSPSDAAMRLGPSVLTRRHDALEETSDMDDPNEPFSDHHTPVEEFRGPFFKSFPVTTPLSQMDLPTPPLPPPLPRRSSGLVRSSPAPPTPPRRSQSYLVTGGLRSKQQQEEKSPFDTTDDSESSIHL